MVVTHLTVTRNASGSSHGPIFIRHTGRLIKLTPVSDPIEVGVDGVVSHNSATICLDQPCLVSLVLGGQLPHQLLLLLQGHLLE